MRISSRFSPTPAHDEYAELRDWCPYFQPEEFDLAAADEAVRHPPEYWE